MPHCARCMIGPRKCGNQNSMAICRKQILNSYILNSILTLLLLFWRYYISQCNALRWTIHSMMNESKAMHLIFYFVLLNVKKIFFKYKTLMFKDIHTFIQQACIKLVKSNSKEIENVTKCITVSTKLLSSTTVFNIGNNKCFLSSKSAY